MNTREADMPESDLVMDVLATTDGRFVLVQANSPGRTTGYAYIGNPYFLPKGHPGYDEYWRMKDGETVIVCEKDDPRAMPVADAYAKFRDECDEAYIESLIQEDRWEAEEKGIVLPHGDVGDLAPLTHKAFSILGK